MYRPIIVNLDGSEHAEEVLPYVKKMAEATGAEIELNRVVANAGEIAAASNYLSSVASRLGEHVTINVEQGAIAGAITEEIKSQPNSLAILTTHGRTGVREMLLGSVAFSVVKTVGKPVLIYRPRGHAPGNVDISSVVVALDGTSFPEAILPSAIQLALDLKAKLTLVQAIEPFRRRAARRSPSGDELAGLVDPGIPVSDALESAYLMGLAHEVESKHKLEVDWEVLHGDPGAAICHFLDGRKDAILAVTAHARPAVERIVFGSVTAACIRGADGPILVYWQK
ncbi:MAG TPA: universal stress protein [Dehalococcoidia bacterium]|nr:universal stress protein [Dehalococcoidia bacterium]